MPYLENLGQRPKGFLFEYHIILVCYLLFCLNDNMLEGKSLSSINKILPDVLLEAGIGSPKSNYNFGGSNANS